MVLVGIKSSQIVQLTQGGKRKFKIKMEGVSVNQNAGVSQGKKLKFRDWGSEGKKMKCGYMGYGGKIKIEW